MHFSAALNVMFVVATVVVVLLGLGSVYRHCHLCSDRKSTGAPFVLVYSRGLFGVRLCEDPVRSSRRAGPSVHIGRNNLQLKVVSAKTWGLVFFCCCFVNAGREPTVFSAHK